MYRLGRVARTRPMKGTEAMKQLEDIRPETLQLVMESLDLQDDLRYRKVTKAQYKVKYAALNTRARDLGITGADVSEAFNVYLESIG